MHVQRKHLLVRSIHPCDDPSASPQGDGNQQNGGAHRSCGELSPPSWPCPHSDGLVQLIWAARLTRTSKIENSGGLVYAALCEESAIRPFMFASIHPRVSRRVPVRLSRMLRAALNPIWRAWSHFSCQHADGPSILGRVASSFLRMTQMTTIGKFAKLGTLVVGAVFLALALVVSSHARVLSSNSERQVDSGTIRPFHAHVPDRILTDLQRRLAETRWPDQLPGTSWEYGADIKKVRELALYWQTQYNWRRQEARINQFHQYTTEIDGQQIYFIHERSPFPNAVPLLLIHGWPGSTLEFTKMIEPLTRPNQGSMPAFNVVIPALPGFGFSGPTATRGWSPKRMAKAFIMLMDRLGYSRYGIQGGDWGSTIARDIAYEAPSHVIGLHLNLLYADPPNQEAIAQMSDSERRRYSFFQTGESSFFNLQASEPQTVAYALTDSPVGWLAWMVDKFQMLTDNQGDFLAAVDRDTFLTDVMLYWVTGTVGSAMRIYRENRLSGEGAAQLPHLDTPVAFADFPKEVFTSPLSWIKQTYNVVQVTEMPRGGHFAALEQPDLLVEDVRKFFAQLNSKTTASCRGVF